MKMSPTHSDGTKNTWASLDQWMADLITEWDAKLPRELSLRIETNMLLLKAAELGTPYSTTKILERYATFINPIRDHVDQNLTADERKRIEDHDARYS